MDEQQFTAKSEGPCTLRVRAWVHCDLVQVVRANRNDFKDVVKRHLNTTNLSRLLFLLAEASLDTDKSLASEKYVVEDIVWAGRTLKALKIIFLHYTSVCVCVWHFTLWLTCNDWLWLTAERSVHLPFKMCAALRFLARGALWQSRWDVYRYRNIELGVLLCFSIFDLSSSSCGRCAWRSSNEW